MVACPVPTPKEKIAYIFSQATKLRIKINAKVEQKLTKSEFFTHGNVKVDNASYGSRE